MMTEGLESLNEVSGGSGGVEAVEVIVAEFLVGCIGRKNLEGDS